MNRSKRIDWEAERRAALARQRDREFEHRARARLSTEQRRQSRARRWLQAVWATKLRRYGYAYLDYRMGLRSRSPTPEEFGCTVPQAQAVRIQISHHLRGASDIPYGSFAPPGKPRSSGGKS